MIDEYYDEDDDELLFVPPSYYSSDEQLVLFACLLLIRELFEKLNSMTPEEILEEINGVLDNFESELVATATSQVDSAVYESLRQELVEWNIPIFGDYVQQDVSMYPIMEDSIHSAVSQLEYDLKAKTQFFIDNLSKDTFNVKPNIRRIIRGVVDAVGNNHMYAKEKTHRNVLNFIYGDDALYKWYHMNDSRVCDWCIAQGNEPPRRIEDIPLDHPNGRCIIEPIDEVYSNEYYSLLID